MTTRFAPDELLERVPLFPLPNLVFFPNTLLPLHVFEPRYLALVEDVLAGDKLLGVAHLQPGYQGDYYGAPPLHAEFGLGEVVRRDEVSGGRCNILVRGLHRARIETEHETELLYRVVRARVFDAPEQDDADVLRELAVVRQLFASVVARTPDADLDDVASLFRADAPASFVLDSIASALPLEPAEKQRLLSEARPGPRAQLLAEALANHAIEQTDALEPGSAIGSD